MSNRAAKVVMVGDTGTGKTLFIYSAMNAKESSDTRSKCALINTAFTIGTDMNEITCPLSNNKKLSLIVWDTAGQERFHSITTAYYRKAVAVLLFYAVDDRASFESLESNWIKRIRKDFPDGELPELFIMTNKVDIPKREHRVTDGEADRLAEKLGATRLRTSSYMNRGNYARTTLNIIAAKLVRSQVVYADGDKMPQCRRSAKIVRIGGADNDHRKKSCCKH